MWKILSGISALLLLVSAGFAYMNYSALRDEKARVSAAKDRRTQAEERRDEADRALSEANTEFATLTTEKQEAETERAEAATKRDESTAQLAAKQTELEAAEERRLTFKTELEKIGPIEEVQAKIAQLRTQLQEANENFARLKNVEALTLDEERRTKEQIAKAQELVSNQYAGRMPQVTTSVRNVYGQWWFLVIGAGSRQGVVRQATLDITRGGEIIAKAQVSMVEPNQSVASIIRDSVAPGIVIQPGDRVTVASTSIASNN
jgi:hypothetical protein